MGNPKRWWHHGGMARRSRYLTHPSRIPRLAGPVLALIVLGGCSSEPPTAAAPSPSVTANTPSPAAPDTSNADHPDVLNATLERDGDDTWRLEVTLSSQYDSAERYADGWRVLDEEGNVLGDHTLTHDHADEQPVTRVQTGLKIPDSIDVITVEGKDTVNGYGGQTIDVEVQR